MKRNLRAAAACLLPLLLGGCTQPKDALFVNRLASEVRIYSNRSLEFLMAIPARTTHWERKYFDKPHPLPEDLYRPSGKGGWLKAECPYEPANERNVLDYDKEVVIVVIDDAMDWRPSTLPKENP